MTIRKIKGILFDFGDTLLDFGDVDILGLFKSGAHLAYDYLREHRQPLPSFTRYYRLQLWTIRWHYFKSRLTGREFNCLDLIGRLSSRMGQTLTRDQILELAWLWYKPLSESGRLEEGVRQMLQAFHDDGLKLGVISNTFIPGEILDRHLQREDLLKLLPTRIYSCNVGCRKPNPKIFAAALKQAKLQPAETIFVGDSLRADIRGANRTGMISVLKDPSGRYADGKAGPRYRIGGLVQLQRIVAEYNGDL